MGIGEIVSGLQQADFDFKLHYTWNAGRSHGGRRKFVSQRARWLHTPPLWCKLRERDRLKPGLRTTSLRPA